MKYFSVFIFIGFPVCLLADDINLGVNISGTTAAASCSVSTISARFALTVSNLPVGSESYATVAWKSGAATCSSKTSGISCSDITLPHYRVSCDGTKTGTVSFSGSSTATSSGKTLTVNTISAAYGTGTSLSSGQSISVSSGSDLDIYLGAKFIFPSNLVYSTEYTWGGTISNAITINF